MPEPLNLTKRQREILHWRAVGLPNRLIAKRLDIAMGTVRTTIGHALLRNDVHSIYTLLYRLGFDDALNRQDDDRVGRPWKEDVVNEGPTL